LPTTPYKPNAKNSASLGSLAGIFIGAAFIIFRERMDRTIQKPGDTNFYLNLPELGIIPSAKIDKEGHPSLVVSDSSYQMIELVTWRHKPSSIAESFRSTLFSILFAAENSVKPKVLMLTSAGPSEGKSTVASNLAVAISEVGQRILLIDADLRRPRQHEIFKMENESGLSNLLRRRTELNGDISLGGLIRESSIPGLFVLTSGPPASAATNLLYSSYFPEFLNYVRDQFDVVLIDTPPMLQIPDARIVGRSADKVIMVVRAGYTTRDAALAARQRFSEDGTEILGTILNDFDPKSSGSGHHGYYNYRYSARARKREEVSRS
jgi:capsular exopolysaccharide synthesis family protein